MIEVSCLKKVWVLLLEDYSGKQQLLDVYSTKEKAQRAKDTILSTSNWLLAPVIKEKEIL
jgi:hypothetical protein